MKAVYAANGTVQLREVPQPQARPLGEGGDAEAYLVHGKRLGKVVLDIS